MPTFFSENIAKCERINSKFYWTIAVAIAIAILIWNKINLYLNCVGWIVYFFNLFVSLNISWHLTTWCVYNVFRVVPKLKFKKPHSPVTPLTSTQYYFVWISLVHLFFSSASLFVLLIKTICIILVLIKESFRKCYHRQSRFELGLCSRFAK